ncbi:MAG: gliding motility-associated ABC transporter substrate-binding protein GldG [Flavobacteriaceae bacterium]|nr:gliding motility-associated ABC transporter substrate-binding protein GldG [Flavobacteriaceae bacterium]|tara:strand:+ start:8967 stop:10652 length:1686 start_codon:yes stop_codon:yes gene_type:complete
MNKQKPIFVLLITIVVLVVMNWISSEVYERFDLTQDQRYTLSEASKNTLANVDSPIIVDVFLKGSFPPEFRRLQVETRQLLEEFSAYNPNLKVEFINPLEGEEDQAAVQQQLSGLGLTPAQVEVQQNGKVTTEVVYPWALAYYNGKTVKIPLLKNQLGTTSEERVTNSLQNLEYAFADGFSKLTQPKRRKVAVLKGNGQLPDRYIADFFTTLREYYYIAPFTLDSVAVDPQRTLASLSDYDLIVSAQPTETFSEEEKYVLDQYTMQGGASLWLVDMTQQQTDSVSGNNFAFGRDLNLNDFLFKYGIRINPNLVKDIYSAPIVLASGNERDAQYNRYPWLYYPLVGGAEGHPIVTNTEAVKLEYASAIDTLPNNIKKTVLLETSPLSKTVGLPLPIDFDTEIPKNLKIVNEGPEQGDFNNGPIPLAVLLEGSFTSVYNNRVPPINLPNRRNESVATKMVIVSDGNVIMNQLQEGRPIELGFDKFTGTFFGNKEFLLNTVNYLLDDNGLINIRTKEIAVPFLDPQKTSAQRTQWQLLNVLLPLVLLGVIGFVFQFFRKRSYRR